MSSDHPLIRAVEVVPGGSRAISRACGVSMQAFNVWLRNGRLPRTEFTGETQYAEIIERLSARKIRAKRLLEWSRRAWCAGNGVSGAAS